MSVCVCVGGGLQIPAHRRGLSSSSLWTLNSGFGCDSEETPQDTLEAANKRGAGGQHLRVS